MDRKFSVPVRREFEKALTELWPQFKPAKFDHPIFKSGGWRIYRWETDVNVWFFLVLGISQKFNDFSIELFWNTTDHCPIVNFIGCGEQDPWLLAKNRCQIIVPRGLGFEIKSWKVGSNPSFLPQVVVPPAVNEMKAFADPIIKKVLELHGKKTITT